MTDQPGIIPDLAALLVASLARRHDSAYYAVRIAERLALANDATDAAAEAGLRKALGPVLDRKQLRTVLAALEDAADYRREYRDGDCADCDALPKGELCGDHDTDRAMASMYDLMAGELQEHQGRETPGGGKPPRLRCARCGTELAWIDASPIDEEAEENVECTDRSACGARQAEDAAPAAWKED